MWHHGFFRLVLNGATNFKEYAMDFIKTIHKVRCYVEYWEEKSLKKVCVDCQPLEQAVPCAELISLARFVTSLQTQQLPMCLRGVSASLLRVLSDGRDDDRQFVVVSEFSEELFLHCFCRAHQDFFGMVEVVTIVLYLIQRMKGALDEEWTDDRPLLRRCIREGLVNLRPCERLQLI